MHILHNTLSDNLLSDLHKINTNIKLEKSTLTERQLARLQMQYSDDYRTLHEKSIM